MRVGLIGASGIAGKHAQAYRNIGYQIAAVTDRTEERGRKFAAAWGAEFVATPEHLCQRAGKLGPLRLILRENYAQSGIAAAQKCRERAVHQHHARAARARHRVMGRIGLFALPALAAWPGQKRPRARP